MHDPCVETELLVCEYCGEYIVIVEGDVGWVAPSAAELVRLHGACLAAARYGEAQAAG
jgi:hypothetical protein